MAQEVAMNRSKDVRRIDLVVVIVVFTVLCVLAFSSPTWAAPGASGTVPAQSIYLPMVLKNWYGGGTIPGTIPNAKRTYLPLILREFTGETAP